MVRKARNEIILGLQILTPDEIRDTVFQEYSILSNLEGADRRLEWLVRFGLIPNTKNCAICLSGMSLVKRKQKTSPYRWRCCACKKFIPLTERTIFHYTKIEY